MKPAIGMVLGSVVTAAIAALVIGADARQEIWFGMLAPLVVAVASWLAGSAGVCVLAVLLLD